MTSTRPNDAGRRSLALADLLALRVVSDPQISPDGRQVAFVEETLDHEANAVRSRIWLVGAEEGDLPRPLTAGVSRDSQPRWSPDGQAIAFVSNRDGASRVWVLPMNGGEPRRLVDQPAGAHDPAWSPDCCWVAFIAPGPEERGEPAVVEPDPARRVVRLRELRHKLDGRGFFGPERNHVWIASTDGSTVEQLTDGPFDDDSPCWSPDSRTIAFVSDRSPDRQIHYGGGAIHLVDVVTREVRRLTSQQRRAARPSWSPDGRWIGFVGSESVDDASAGQNFLWRIVVDGSEAHCLTADLERSVGERPGGYLTPSAPAWCSDSDRLLYLLSDGPSTQFARFGRGTRELLTDGRQVVHAFSIDTGAKRAALLVSDPVTPAEIWIWDDERGAWPVTTRNADLLEQVALIQPEDIRLTRPDGTVVEGWLLRPPRAGSGPVPLIMIVHGGPHNYFGDVFSFDQQLYAAQGYAVLYVNPRGSGGYGEAFARAVCRDWGGEDYHDLMAVLDAVIARNDPPIDTRRLGITGSSYGGFMTCWAITQTSRFAAAASGACISDLVSFAGTSDIGATWGVQELGMLTEERRDWYIRRSPLHRVEAVETPVLLYHGEADLRCPIGQSEQMFTALYRFGKTVEFLRVPGESHAVLEGSPVHRLVVRQALLDWFNHYLAAPDNV